MRQSDDTWKPLRNALDSILKAMGQNGLAIPTKHHNIFTEEEQDKFWEDAKSNHMKQDMEGKLHYTSGKAFNEVVIIARVTIAL